MGNEKDADGWKKLPGAKLPPSELVSSIPDAIVEKYDPVLPKELRDLGYGTKFFDEIANGAWQWFSESSG